MMAPSKPLLPSAQTKLVITAMGKILEHLQASLSALLSKFDTMDLRISNLGKQIEATQESVDEIRHHQAEVGAALACSIVTELGATSTSRQAPRLANLQPPLLEAPEEQVTGPDFMTAPPSPMEPVVAAAEVREQAPELRRDARPVREHVPGPQREFAPDLDRDYAIKPPKNDSPCFNGENPISTGKPSSGVPKTSLMACCPHATDMGMAQCYTPLIAFLY